MTVYTYFFTPSGLALDITTLLMRKGFVYLTAVIDWYSRKVLAHRFNSQPVPKAAYAQWPGST